MIGKSARSRVDCARFRAEAAIMPVGHHEAARGQLARLVIKG